MGGKKSKPEPPKKTIKGDLYFSELVKEFSKTIRKLQRDFQREISKLEFSPVNGPFLAGVVDDNHRSSIPPRTPPKT